MKNLEQWHKWFAWYPININNKSIWMKKVWRKGTFWYAGSMDDGWNWQYQEHAPTFNTTPIPTNVIPNSDVYEAAEQITKPIVPNSIPIRKLLLPIK